jgi:hypothetical protein
MGHARHRHYGLIFPWYHSKLGVYWGKYQTTGKQAIYRPYQEKNYTSKNRGKYNRASVAICQKCVVLAT